MGMSFRKLFLGVGLLLFSRHAQAQQCIAPNILILFDVSGSMKGSKYVTAINGIDRAITALQSGAQFALTIFPQPGVGLCATQTHDDGTIAYNVPFAVNNEPAIRQFLFPDGANYFGGPQGNYDTPIYQVLAEASRAPELGDTSRPEAIILVTDGMQDCCRDCADDYKHCVPHNDCSNIQSDILDPDMAALNRQNITSLVAQMAANRIKTYAVGFGGEADVQMLQMVAAAGGTQPSSCDSIQPTTCYYHADDVIGLRDALSQIVEQVSTDVCNGFDDDCDGDVDNIPHTTNPVSQNCTTACGLGVQYCNAEVGSGAPSFGACSARQPSVETCDGIDNDCDGYVDNAPGVHQDYSLTQNCSLSCGDGFQTCTSSGWSACQIGSVDGHPITDCTCGSTGTLTATCGPIGSVLNTTEPASKCQLGTATCANGNWSACQGAVYPDASESCNGIDDNCNGFVDEDPIDPSKPLTQSCDTACGAGLKTCVACAAGSPGCTNGKKWSDCATPVIACSTPCGPGNKCVNGQPSATCVPNTVTSLCNGIYNECNSKPTQNCECNPGDQKPCGVTTGECTQGVQRCQWGQWSTCVGGNQGQPEICNGLDDNCDGLVDNGPNLCPQGQACVCGLCQPLCDQNGQCALGGQCVEGACTVDYCPTGKVCKGQQCVAGNQVNTPDTSTSVAPLKPALPTEQATRPAVRSGCGCATTSNADPTTQALLSLLTLIGPLILIRRLRSRS